MHRLMSITIRPRLTTAVSKLSVQFVLNTQKYPHSDVIILSSLFTCVGFWMQESTGDVGWGRRTGGVILAGEAETICGVPFDGNVMRRNQQVGDSGPWAPKYLYRRLKPRQTGGS